MLDGAGDYVSGADICPYRSNQCEIIGLSPTSGEDDFVGVGVEKRRDLSAGSLDGFTCFASFGVLAGSVTERVARKGSIASSTRGSSGVVAE